MAIHAQTSCTLSTITDVEAVYTYYYLSDSTITVDEAPKDGVNAPGAQTITVISDGESYIWQLTEPELDIEDDVIQTAVGKLYYIECVKFSNGTYDWGPLMTSSTYAAAKAAYNLSYQAIQQAQAANEATALLGGHFIYNSTWQTSNTPHSVNVVQTVVDNGIDVSDDPTKWEYNTHIGANGIRLRYNEIILSEWKTDSLIFYIPIQNNNNLVQGEKGLEITASGINIYNPSGSKGLEIDSTGMIIYDINESPVIAAKSNIFNLGFDLAELDGGFDPYGQEIEDPFIVWKKETEGNEGINYLYEYVDDILIRNVDITNNKYDRYSLKDKISVIEQNIETNTEDILNNQNDIKLIKDDIAAIENNLNIANNNISTNANNISVNTSNISVIDTRINKIKAYWKINENNHLILIREEL